MNEVNVMATIALFSNKVNLMPELLKGMKQSVSDFNSELSTFKTKTLKVNRNICNLDDVTSKIQTTLNIQDDKIISLDTLNKNSEAFVASTVLIDSNVADIINQSKDDFYNTYDYLKPNCEKSTWEIIKDSVTDAVEWCIDTWNFVVETIKVALNAIGDFILTAIYNALIDPLIEIASLALAITEVVWGVLTQVGASIIAYAAFSFLAIFDRQIRSDMNAIGWNPFNSDVSLIEGEHKGQKVSFYKGMPVIRMSLGDEGRSASFLAIWLDGTCDADEINHEWGHGVQQSIMGPLRYLLLIAIPSNGRWGSAPDYYNQPWEINADMFGGVSRVEHTQEYIEQGWRYFWAAKYPYLYDRNNEVLNAFDNIN